MQDLRPRLDYLDAPARHRVLAALEVASVAHDGQKRKSGEPFIIHPIAVAAILADMRMDRDSIIAGLLHDTVEDTHVTFEELENLFGKDVRKIVEGETKFSKLATKFHGQASAAAAAAAAADARGCLSKRSDRPELDSSVSVDKDIKEDSVIDAHPLGPSEKLNGATNHSGSLNSQQANAILSPNGSALFEEGSGLNGFVWARSRDQAKREAERDKQADNLRSMFLAMTEDVRVIIVKLADRLHNMRTLEYMSPTKQKTISRETLEFFAPLAHRLGMRRIKSELEELSFRYLYPDEYRSISNEVETLKRRVRFEQVISSAEAVVRDILQNDAILHNMTRSVQIKGSVKELYSIYRRVLRGEALSSMLDIATLCVVVDLDPSIDCNQACYHVLGRLHALWTPLPKRLKDYIAFPKPNGYQSLHTTVLLDSSHMFFPLEIQIRTAAMHRIAEEGIAAELFQSSSACVSDNSADKSAFKTADANTDDGGVPRPKTNRTVPSVDLSKGLPNIFHHHASGTGTSVGMPSAPSIPRGDDEWRRRTKGWLVSIRHYIEEFTSSRDLVDAVRRDLLGNRVFVFTPKGRIVDLPNGSTPVDLAYAIHSDVGYAMIGAKINGRMVGLDYRLQNADVVKIITSNCSPGPSEDWVSYAKTRTARQKIRQVLRVRERESMIERGCSMLAEAARKRLEPEPSEAALAEVMPKVRTVLGTIPELRYIRSVDDLLIAICRGHQASGHLSLEETVLTILRGKRQSVFGPSLASVASSEKSQLPSTGGVASEKALEGSLSGGSSSEHSGNALNGEEVSVVELGSCCHPIRGDDVVGVRLAHNQRAVVVHRVQCDHLLPSRLDMQPNMQIVAVRWVDDDTPPWNDIARVDSDRSAVRSDDDCEQSLNMADSKLVNDKRNCQPGLIAVSARDCDGLLSYVTGIVAGLHKSIRRSFTETDPRTSVATLAFEVLVEDVKELQKIIDRLKECEEVISVRRIGPNEGKEYFPSSKRFDGLRRAEQSASRARMIELIPSDVNTNAVNPGSNVDLTNNSQTKEVPYTMVEAGLRRVEVEEIDEFPATQQE